MARRTLVGLIVREGDGTGSAIISPAAGRVRRRSEGDSRVSGEGNSTIRCLDYGTAVGGGEDALSVFYMLLSGLFVLLRHSAVKRAEPRTGGFYALHHRLERRKALRSRAL